MLLSAFSTSLIEGDGSFSKFSILVFSADVVLEVKSFPPYCSDRFMSRYSCFKVPKMKLYGAGWLLQSEVHFRGNKTKMLHNSTHVHENAPIGGFQWPILLIEKVASLFAITDFAIILCAYFDLFR